MQRIDNRPHRRFVRRCRGDRWPSASEPPPRRPEPNGHAGVAATVPADPLAQELARCNTLGMAAKDDARCQAAWAANRLRFFAPFLTHLSGPAANLEPRVPK